MPHDRNSIKPGERRANEGKAWSRDEERKLHGGFRRLRDINELSLQHARTSGAIRSRLKVLGLLDATGKIIIPKPAFIQSRTGLTKNEVDNISEIHVLTEHCDDAQLMELFYRLSMKQRRFVLDFVRWLVARIDRD